MARYIDADKTLDAMLYEMAGTGYQSRAMNIINFAPTADVVEVVRCNKCSHCEIVIDQFDNDWYFCKKTANNAEVKPNDFCSYGTPKERGGEK